MPFALRKDESIRKGLARLFAREVKSALKNLERTPLTPEAVHEARTHIKKSRAVLRLIRKRAGGIGPATDNRLRASGRSLSSLRDATVMVATTRGLCMSRDRGLTNAACELVREDLSAHARRLKQRDQRAAAAARRRLRSIARSAKHLRVKRFGDTGLKRGVERAYDRARREMQAACGQGASRSAFHEWRKRVKALAYQLRLLSARAPAFRRRADALRRLEQQLGHEHNLQVLGDYATRRRVSGRKKIASRLTALARERQTQLRRSALRAGARMFSETPKAFVQHGFG